MTGPDGKKRAAGVGVDVHVDVEYVRGAFPSYFGNPASMSVTVEKGLHEMLQTDESVVIEILGQLKVLMTKVRVGGR